jgi:hypothetical protein
MNTLGALLLLPLLVLSPLCVFAQGAEKKPRVIVMTDGEIDDHSSMIRFLLYTSDIDLQAIIETNSVYQRSGHSKKDWLEKQLDAYEKVYPNLIKHHPGYPTADAIRKKSFVGDEDPEHLMKVTSRAKRNEQKPGAPVEYRPDAWPDTPGSDKIVQVLLEKSPDPVYIQVWGGGNTASRAFYKLKTQHPNDYERAVSKVVMYNIWYQDDAGNYIETFHPKVTMLYCASFSGTWDYRSQPDTTDFITHHVKNHHGPLGALYPQTYVSEGDSPAFFYTINNGLRNHEHPTYGGWGGRFTRLDAFAHGYTDAADDGDVKKSLRRWIPHVNNDFQARMDWCVADKFSDANHNPIVKVSGETDRTITAGQTVTLSAAGTTDPDGDKLTYRWWHYKEAGTYDGPVTIENPTKEAASFVAPNVARPSTIHLLLEVSDNGTPALVSYKRIIVTVVPKSTAPTAATVPQNRLVQTTRTSNLTTPQSVEQWDVFEVQLPGPAEGNPFVDVKLSARFTNGNDSTIVQGFYDGNGTYRVRFAPPHQGEWKYLTSSNRPELDGKGGSFRATTPTGKNHGPVRVHKTFHFVYADGTPYYQVGTTCYVWTHQPEELQEQTLKTLAQSPFNKLRMCIFPKSFAYNQNEPSRFAFVRGEDGMVS